MNDLPDGLVPLTGIRNELVAVLDLLDQERDPTARADLATELVGISAKYEDVLDRCVYPALRGIRADLAELDRAESDQQAIREGLSDLRKRTQNVKPSNVHVSDPDGFEQLLDRLTELIRAHLDHDETLFPLLGQLTEQQIGELRTDVENAVTHASSKPHPPQSSVGRAVSGVMEKLNRGVHDQSTVSHPEVEQLHDELEVSEESE